MKTIRKILEHSANTKNKAIDEVKENVDEVKENVDEVKETVDSLGEDKVLEAGANVNRLKKHLEDNVSFIIGTAYRGQYSNNENRLRNKEFVETFVKPSGLSFIQVKGKWEEEGTGKVSEERSLFIMGKNDGSDDAKLKKLSDILVKNPQPDVDEKEQVMLPAKNGFVGYIQDSVVMKLSSDDKIYLYDKNGRITDFDLGDVFSERTEEEIYSTIKNNDFAIASKPVKELLEMETSNVITLSKQPSGMAGHLKEKKILEFLVK